MLWFFLNLEIQAMDFDLVCMYLQGQQVCHKVSVFLTSIHICVLKLKMYNDGMYLASLRGLFSIQNVNVKSLFVHAK